jgi:hypothetical protein
MALFPTSALLGALQEQSRTKERVGGSIGAGLQSIVQGKRQRAALGLQREQLALEERRVKKQEDDARFVNTLKLAEFMFDSGQFARADELINGLAEQSNGAITVVEPGSDPDRTKGVVKMSKKFNSGEVPKETFFSGLKLLHKGRSIAPRELRRQKASLEVKKLQQDILDKQKAQQQRQRLKETTQSFLTGQQGVPGQPATGELEAQLRGVPLGGQTAQVQLPELAGELAEAGQLGQLKQFAPEAPEAATDIEKRRVAVEERRVAVAEKEADRLEKEISDKRGKKKNLGESDVNRFINDIEAEVGSFDENNNFVLDDEDKREAWIKFDRDIEPHLNDTERKRFIRRMTSRFGVDPRVKEQIPKPRPAKAIKPTKIDLNQFFKKKQ